MKCGLLGERLVHSYSPQIHQHLGQYSYELVEKQENELPEFFETFAYNGLNVTIPYKSAVIPYCSSLSPVAQRLGSVNTIVRKNDGSLIGHNTDYFGFETMLLTSGLAVKGKKVLVLGTGGTSKTAVAVLQDHGANVVIISRSGENNYSNLELHTDAAVVVNTTPVGMYPKNGIAPLCLFGLTLFIFIHVNIEGIFKLHFLFCSAFDARIALAAHIIDLSFFLLQFAVKSIHIHRRSNLVFRIVKRDRFKHKLIVASG